MTATPRPTVYLHVGEPKSGTSFLQSVLWGNRDLLEERGVTMPGEGTGAHYRAYWDLRGQEQHPHDSRGSWAGAWDVLAEQARSVASKSVISAEMLSAATAEQAERAVRSLEPAEVHVVLTVREFTSLLPTEWQESVKHRNPMSWSFWLDQVSKGPSAKNVRARRFWDMHDTVAILRRWGSMLPPEHVHVVVAPGPEAPREALWERFAEVLGIDAAGFDLGVARGNSSLGVPEIDFLRRLNGTLPPLPHWYYVKYVRDRISYGVLAKRSTGGSSVQLTGRHRAWAQQHAESVYASVQAAGYDLIGSLDDLRPRPFSSTAAELGSTTSAQLVEIGMECLARMFEMEWQSVAATRRPMAPTDAVSRAPKAARRPLPGTPAGTVFAPVPAAGVDTPEPGRPAPPTPSAPPAPPAPPAPVTPLRRLGALRRRPR